MPRLVAERSDILPKLAETFRTRGYEGASLAHIGKATGLGKGSLYHFFPGGKAEMAEAVLAEMGAWFENSVFAPLRSIPAGDAAEARARISESCRAVERYFASGRRVCLFAVFALSETRSLFEKQVRDYFRNWVEALARALVVAGRGPAAARTEAFDAVATIQGAIVLARAASDERVFAGALARIEARLLG
ncbi:MAG: TetR family transcriptional regulator [Alphaproteobacteria bacterium]|nr:TetR family transcriptional regulator [Alphaproteobacteria bacterium]